MRKITFLGTAAGMKCLSSHCTSLLIEDDSTNLLVDTSGGHEILQAFHEAQRQPKEVQNIFISHYDSDHILGIIPLVRALRRDPRPRTVFCSQDTKNAIDALFTYTASAHYNDIPDLSFHIVKDGDAVDMGKWKVTFFDLQSGKTPQHGCAIAYADGKKLAFLGDEPLTEHALPYVKNSDVFIHEAFCTSDTAEQFKPYEKHHGTAKDAGENAMKAQAKLLATFHMEDDTLVARKEKYAADIAKSGFTGDIFIPVDSDILTF